jgi:hypothetical protein
VSSWQNSESVAGPAKTDTFQRFHAALGSTGTSGVPSTLAGCPAPSRSGSLCRRTPPLVGVGDRWRLTLHLLPGDPDALLLGEEAASFSSRALDRLGLTLPQTEVLCAGARIKEEADVIWELFLGLHAVRERVARLEAKLGVRSAAEAVGPALRESM